MQINIPIIDSHVHLPLWKGNFAGSSINPNNIFTPSPHFSQYKDTQQEKWRKEWGFPKPDHKEKSPEEIGSLWYQEAIKYNLEKVVLVTAGGNLNMAKIINMYPDKFVGLAHHSPEDPRALVELTHYVENYGFKGYKMLSQRITVPWEHPALAPVWDFLHNNSLCSLIHFGVGGGPGGVGYHPLIDPLTIFKTAQKYYNISFIIPHFGDGYYKEALQLAWTCPNVYIDTSGSNQWMKWLPYHLDVKGAIEKAMNTIGSERLLFGTDSSWFPRGFAAPYLYEQYSVCKELALSELEIKNIFYNNSKRLFKL